jgi:hypothetical protein
MYTTTVKVCLFEQQKKSEDKYIHMKQSTLVHSEASSHDSAVTHTDHIHAPLPKSLNDERVRLTSAMPGSLQSDAEAQSRAKRMAMHRHTAFKTSLPVVPPRLPSATGRLRSATAHTWSSSGTSVGMWKLSASFVTSISRVTSMISRVPVGHSMSAGKDDTENTGHCLPRGARVFGSSFEELLDDDGLGLKNGADTEPDELRRYLHDADAQEHDSYSRDVRGFEAQDDGHASNMDSGRGASPSRREFRDSLFDDITQSVCVDGQSSSSLAPLIVSIRPPKLSGSTSGVPSMNWAASGRRKSAFRRRPSTLSGEVRESGSMATSPCYVNEPDSSSHVHASSVVDSSTHESQVPDKGESTKPGCTAQKTDTLTPKCVSLPRSASPLCDLSTHAQSASLFSLHTQRQQQHAHCVTNALPSLVYVPWQPSSTTRVSASTVSFYTCIYVCMCLYPR